MARKAAQKAVIPTGEGVNKGIIAEFIFFLIFQGFDFYAVIGVFSESRSALSTYRALEALNKTAQVSQTGNVLQTTPASSTSPLLLCTSEGVYDAFSARKIGQHIDSYEFGLNVFLFFFVITCGLFNLHFLYWVALLVMSSLEANFLQEHWHWTVRAKLCFTVGASFLQDIPISTITMELYLLRRGNSGLICWQCALDPKCTNNDYIGELSSQSTRAMAILVIAICIITLWKGISGFFRWARDEHCDIFPIRALASIFAGFIYMTIILTPCMTILKYRYFNLPGVTRGFIADVIDRFFIVGAMIWSVGILAVCCCPLLNLIKLAQ